MNRYLFQVRVVFLQLQALSSVLFVLFSNITRHSRYSAIFLLSALQYNLNSVSFFSHFFMYYLVRFTLYVCVIQLHNPHNA